MNSPHKELQILIKEAYVKGFEYHGSFDLNPEGFRDVLFAVLNKHLGTAFTQADACTFIRKLYTTDLYLTVASVLSNELAWNRFVTVYEKHILDFALRFSGNRDIAYDIASTVLADMFLPDSSGNSRLASYDGQSSLLTWLRVIVHRRLINEREAKWNSHDRIEHISETTDQTWSVRVDMSIRANRYESLIWDSFETAIKALTDRERLLLLWRYEDGLQVTQIARSLDTTPSTITKRLESARKKIRQEIMSTLSSKYLLSPAGIEECFREAVENPGYTLLGLMRTC